MKISVERRPLNVTIITCSTSEDSHQNLCICICPRAVRPTGSILSMLMIGINMRMDVSSEVTLAGKFSLQCLRSPGKTLILRSRLASTCTVRVRVEYFFRSVPKAVRLRATKGVQEGIKGVVVARIVGSIENDPHLIQSDMYSAKLVFIALTFVASVFGTAISRSKYDRAGLWTFLTYMFKLLLAVPNGTLSTARWSERSMLQPLNVLVAPPSTSRQPYRQLQSVRMSLRP